MKNKQAFTLIEVLLAIAILGILVGMAIPAYNRVMQHQTLYKEAGQLAWDLRAARQEAITTGKATRVDFYYYADAYQVKNKARHYFPEGISYRAKPSFIHQGSMELYCTFAPSGVPSPGGTACLTNRNQELLYVIVNLPAGRVRISEDPPE